MKVCPWRGCNLNSHWGRKEKFWNSFYRISKNSEKRAWEYQLKEEF